MKYQVFDVPVATDNPFVSEQVRMVRESDFLALKDKVLAAARELESLSTSHEARSARFKHPRFAKAAAHWLGSSSALSLAANKLRSLFP